MLFRDAKDETEFVKTITNGFDYFSMAYVTATELEAVARFLRNSSLLGPARDRIVKLMDNPIGVIRQ